MLEQIIRHCSRILHPFQSMCDGRTAYKWRARITTVTLYSLETIDYSETTTLTIKEWNSDGCRVFLLDECKTSINVCLFVADFPGSNDPSSGTRGSWERISGARISSYLCEKAVESQTILYLAAWMRKPTHWDREMDGQQHDHDPHTSHNTFLRSIVG